jgi:hypothetical protein
VQLGAPNALVRSGAMRRTTYVRYAMRRTTYVRYDERLGSPSRRWVHAEGGARGHFTAQSLSFHTRSGAPRG